MSIPQFKQQGELGREDYTGQHAHQRQKHNELKKLSETEQETVKAAALGRNPVAVPLVTCVYDRCNDCSVGNLWG